MPDFQNLGLDGAVLTSYLLPYSLTGYLRVFNKCFVLNSLILRKTRSSEQGARRCNAMKTWEFFNIEPVMLSRPSQSFLNYEYCLRMHLAGKRQRDEPWKVIPHIPKCRFHVAEVPLFTGLWWRGAPIATSCFSPSLFLPPLSLREISWRCKMGNDDICGCRPVHIFVGPLGK